MRARERAGAFAAGHRGETTDVRRERRRAVRSSVRFLAGNADRRLPLSASVDGRAVGFSARRRSQAAMSAVPSNGAFGRGYRTWLLVLLLLLNTLNFADRAILSALAEAVKRDLA